MRLAEAECAPAAVVGLTGLDGHVRRLHETSDLDAVDDPGLVVAKIGRALVVVDRRANADRGEDIPLAGLLGRGVEMDFGVARVHPEACGVVYEVDLELGVLRAVRFALLRHTLAAGHAGEGDDDGGEPIGVERGFRGVHPRFLESVRVARPALAPVAEAGEVH